MSISIKEIAEIVGVSRGTVDRALNNRPGISAEVKAKVLKVAKDHGYRFNRAGRMLSIRKAPPRIGIQMPSIGNDFFLDVLAGIDKAVDELADFGVTVSIKQMKGFDPAKQVSQIRQLIDEGINGLAFVPIDDPMTSKLMDELSEKGVPVIVLNSDISEGQRLCYIGTDYTLSGRTAAGFFRVLAKGRAMQTLVVTGSHLVLGHNQRTDGFVQVAQEHPEQIHILEVVENLDDEQISYDLTKEALKQFPQLDAIYLAAGGVAGTCKAVEESGRDESIEIVCNDVTPAVIDYLKSGTITATIGQQPFAQGYQAVQMLFNFLLDGNRPDDQWLTRSEIVIAENAGQADSENR